MLLCWKRSHTLIADFGKCEYRSWQGAGCLNKHFPPTNIKDRQLTLAHSLLLCLAYNRSYCSDAPSHVVGRLVF